MLTTIATLINTAWRDAFDAGADTFTEEGLIYIRDSRARLYLAESMDGNGYDVVVSGEEDIVLEGTNLSDVDAVALAVSVELAARAAL